jgi:hypothetical protein
MNELAWTGPIRVAPEWQLAQALAEAVTEAALPTDPARDPTLWIAGYWSAVLPPVTRPTSGPPTPYPLPGSHEDS